MIEYSSQSTDWVKVEPREQERLRKVNANFEVAELFSSPYRRVKKRGNFKICFVFVHHLMLTVLQQLQLQNVWSPRLFLSRGFLLLYCPLMRCYLTFFFCNHRTFRLPKFIFQNMVPTLVSNQIYLQKHDFLEGTKRHSHII